MSFLSKLSRLFFGGDEQPGPSPTNSGSVPVNAFVLLRRAASEQAPLTVFLGGSGTAYSSALLELVPDQQYLVIDELVPRSGHELMRPGLELKVRARVEGADMRFKTEILEIGGAAELPFYKIAFPREVDYTQRRQQFRVSVPLTATVDVTFIMDDGRSLIGEVRDMSSGGIGARIKSGTPDAATDQGKKIRCLIVSPSNQSIATDIELIHVDSSAIGRVPRVRGRFINLTPAGARKVAQLCAEIERLQRRATN